VNTLSDVVTPKQHEALILIEGTSEEEKKEVSPRAKSPTQRTISGAADNIAPPEALESEKPFVTGGTPTSVNPFSIPDPTFTEEAGNVAEQVADSALDFTFRAALKPYVLMGDLVQATYDLGKKAVTKQVDQTLDYVESLYKPSPKMSPLAQLYGNPPRQDIAQPNSNEPNSIRLDYTQFVHLGPPRDIPIKIASPQTEAIVDASKLFQYYQGKTSNNDNFKHAPPPKTPSSESLEIAGLSSLLDTRVSNVVQSILVQADSPADQEDNRAVAQRDYETYMAHATTPYAV
jgi:hypothetical protein